MSYHFSTPPVFKTQGDARRWLSDCLHVATSSSARYIPWVRATYELVQGAPRPMKMGTARSPFPYEAAACHALQSARLRYPTTLHYASRALPSILGVCLPFDNGPLDQSRDRRDAHKAGSVIPTHDHLVVHLIENGAVEPYSLLRYRAGSDGSCR